MTAFVTDFTVVLFVAICGVALFSMGVPVKPVDVNIVEFGAFLRWLLESVLACLAVPVAELEDALGLLPFVVEGALFARDFFDAE